MATPQADIYAVDNGQMSYNLDNISKSYTHVVRGCFGNDRPADVFFYDAVTGRGDFFTAHEGGELKLINTHTSLPKWCTQVVVGNFGSSGYDDLLFYAPSRGTIDIYQVNSSSRPFRLATITGVSTSWTKIVSGRFGSTDWHDLFVYDAAAGLGEFWTTDGTGVLTVASRYPSLRRGCTQVVAGNFHDGPCDDLLLYEPGGTGDFYGVEATGKLTHLHTHPAWRKTWSLIIAGDFSNNAFTDLMLLDSTNHEVQFFQPAGGGYCSDLATHTQIPEWTHLVSGRFKPSTPGQDQVLCYTQTVGLDTVWPAPGSELAPVTPPVTPPPVTPPPVTPPPVVVAPPPVTPPKVEPKGRGEVYALENGNLRLVNVIKGMSPKWSHVIAGNFGGPYADLFFYDTSTGRAEVMGMDKAGKLSSLASYPEKWFFPGYRKIAELPRAGYSLLAVYFPGNGGIDIFQVQGKGKFARVQAYETYSSDWTELTGGHFDSSGNPGMVGYDPKSGTFAELRFLKQANDGKFTTLKSNTRWSKTVTRILPGMFDQGGSQTTHLVTYDAANATAQAWNTDGKGGMTAMGAAVTWRKTWSLMVPGHGGFITKTPFILYDPSKGEVSLQALNRNGTFTRQGGQTGLPKDWTQIAARRMWTVNDTVYLFAYSPTGG
ncbi:MAG: hypothetical protein QM708_07025 [Propioniciclava sp.]|uniref:hypothetical protein n=1 Tax=Propioniciclava sp. TaxID=2038686 RepID=UPI0039E3D1EB